MSLIADALRKVGSQDRPLAKQEKPRWLQGGLLTALFGLLLVFFVYAPPSSRQLPQPSPEKTARAATPPAAAIKIAKSNDPIRERLLRTAEERTWQLSGMMSGGDGKSLAVINGEIVEEGSVVFGAKVLKVGSEEVELIEGDQVVRLTLPD